MCVYRSFYCWNTNCSEIKQWWHFAFLIYNNVRIHSTKFECMNHTIANCELVMKFSGSSPISGSGINSMKNSMWNMSTILQQQKRRKTERKKGRWNEWKIERSSSNNNNNHETNKQTNGSYRQMFVSVRVCVRIRFVTGISTNFYDWGVRSFNL